MIAAVLAVAASGAFGQSPGEPNSKPIDQQPQTQQAAPEQPGPSPAPEQPGIVSKQQQAGGGGYKATCDNPKEREDADLCEQRRMADAAERQIWVSAIGVGLVVLSLFLSAWAGLAAARAANAARDQVKLSREALIQTQRAFVFVHRTELAAILDHRTNAIQSWSIAVRWENSGDTPTRRLNIQINLRINDKPLPDDFDFPNYESDVIPTLIGPKATVASNPLDFTLDQMLAVYEERAHFHIWGWAEYNDVFSETKRHRTEFCYKLTFSGNLNDPKRMTAHFALHRKHNGADDECMKPIQTT